jgi:hypothetical protein
MKRRQHSDDTPRMSHPLTTTPGVSPPHREGLDRHDAVRAIGSVLAGHMHALLVGEEGEGEVNERYYKALGKLSAPKWRAG